MRAFRIGPAKWAGNAKDAFSGQGSLLGDGRWHHRGRAIVYSAEHLSLATLEILANLGRKDLIQPHVYWELEIPDDVIVQAKHLPEDWRNAIQSTRSYGDKWLASRTSAVLCVPSVIVPSELNFLINPTHPDFNLKWVTKGPEPLDFDPRLI